MAKMSAALAAAITLSAMTMHKRKMRMSDEARANYVRYRADGWSVSEDFEEHGEDIRVSDQMLWVVVGLLARSQASDSAYVDRIGKRRLRSARFESARPSDGQQPCTHTNLRIPVRGKIPLPLEFAKSTQDEQTSNGFQWVFRSACRYESVKKQARDVRTLPQKSIVTIPSASDCINQVAINP